MDQRENNRLSKVERVLATSWVIGEVSGGERILFFRWWASGHGSKRLRRGETWGEEE